jgi:2-hydroxychromene-2-carboxylate isomerase
VRVLAIANNEDVARKLESETIVARDLGIFASPTFCIEREIFWGDDRLMTQLAVIDIKRFETQRNAKQPADDRKYG